MKKVLTMLLLLLSATPFFAQAPSNLINYQAVARNANGTPLIDRAIRLSFSILDASGGTIYSETKNLTTNKYGLFTHSIGSGNVTSAGSYSNINWATKKSLKVDIDPDNTGFKTLSNEELRSVPMAQYAATAGYATSAGTATTATNATNAQFATTAGTAKTADVALKIPNPINESVKINGNGGATFTLNETTNSMTRIRWSQTNNAKYWDMASYPSLTAEHQPSVLDFWYYNGTFGLSQFQLRGNGKGGFGLNNDAQLIGRVNIVNDDNFQTNPSLALITTRATDYTRMQFLNDARKAKYWEIAAYSGANIADSRFNIFRVDGTGKNLFSIGGDGKVGIGTETSTGFVTIENNDTYERPTLLVKGTGSGVFAYTRIRLANADTRFWDISAFGSANDGRFELVYNNGTTAKSMFTFDRVGNGYAAGAFFNQSDKNLKKNINVLSQSLPFLMQLSGYRYNWKDENSDAKTQIGFLAQDVEKYFPELVRTDEKGIKSVNYLGIIPITVMAIKEQQKTIEDLKKDNEQLKKDNTTLNEQVHSLQNKVELILKQLNTDGTSLWNIPKQSGENREGGIKKTNNQQESNQTIKN